MCVWTRRTAYVKRCKRLEKQTSERKRVGHIILSKCCWRGWGFYWLQMITFQFKSFCMVQVNSGGGSLSLDDEVLFFYACLHNSYLSWCWTDVRFVYGTFIRCWNHGRNVMCVTRSVRLAIFVLVCVFCFSIYQQFYSLCVCNSLKRPIHDPNEFRWNLIYTLVEFPFMWKWNEVKRSRHWRSWFMVLVSTI